MNATQAVKQGWQKVFGAGTGSERPRPESMLPARSYWKSAITSPSGLSTAMTALGPALPLVRPDQPYWYRSAKSLLLVRLPSESYS